MDFFKSLKATKKIFLMIFFFKVNILYSELDTCILISSLSYKDNLWKNQENCPKGLRKQKFSSGSLFKIFIASFALHSQVLNPTKENQEILNQKLVLSDNPFFVDLVKKINKKNFINFLNQELSDYFNTKITLDDFTDDFSFVYGGKLKFYPEEIHHWFIQLALDNREFTKLTFKALLHTDNNKVFYGKSGTWGGAAWFCGVIQSNQEIKVISVLVPYFNSKWKPAKEKAYKNFLENIEN